MNGFERSSYNFSLGNSQISGPSSTSLFSNRQSVLPNYRTFNMATFGRPWNNSTSAFVSRSPEGNATSFYRGPPRDPWGLEGNPIIDDSEPQSTEIAPDTNALVAEKGTSSAEELVEASGEATAEDAAELAVPSALEAGEAEAGPWGLAAIVSQQVGQATSSAIVSGLQNQSQSDYVQNLNQHGLNVGLNADIIRANQENTIRDQQTGGLIGSFFGPIGALIGHAVAGYASANPGALNTAGSFNGWVNPQQSNIVASQSTAGDPGTNTQVDNVDTSNAT